MTPFPGLQARLDQGKVIILDGATGTELQRRGVPMHGFAWSAAALDTHPETIRAVHEDYIRAGADVIITNSLLPVCPPGSASVAGWPRMARSSSWTVAPWRLD